MPRLKVGFRIIILAICHLLKWLNKGLGEEQDLEVYPMHLISWLNNNNNLKANHRHIILLDRKIIENENLI